LIKFPRKNPKNLKDKKAKKRDKERSFPERIYGPSFICSNSHLTAPKGKHEQRTPIF